MLAKKLKEVPEIQPTADNVKKPRRYSDIGSISFKLNVCLTSDVSPCT